MGVTVNAIGPAYVRTRLVAKQIADQARVLRSDAGDGSGVAGAEVDFVSRPSYSAGSTEAHWRVSSSMASPRLCAGVGRRTDSAATRYRQAVP